MDFPDSREGFESSPGFYVRDRIRRFNEDCTILVGIDRAAISSLALFFITIETERKTCLSYHYLIYSLVFLL